MSATKAELRARFRALRAAIPAEARARRAQALAEALRRDPDVASAEVVHAYAACGSEVDLMPLLRILLADGKRVALPRVLADGRMDFHLVASLEALEPGPYGLRQPAAAAPSAPPPELVLVPGLAFTEGGARLGQGAGYYDRFLATHPQARRLGVCFREQLAPALPAEPHDVRMHRVVVG